MKAANVVMFSGGMDSLAALLLVAEKHHDEPVCSVNVHFDTLSTERELSSITDMRDELLLPSNVHYIYVRAPFMGGMYGDDGFFPFRNVILAGIGASIGRKKYKADLTRVWFGFLRNADLPDSTEAFSSTMSKALTASGDSEILVTSPLLSMTKFEAAFMLARHYGDKIDRVMRLAWTCLNPPPGGLECGRCISCLTKYLSLVGLPGIADPLSLFAEDPARTPEAIALYDKLKSRPKSSFNYPEFADRFLTTLGRLQGRR